MQSTTHKPVSHSSEQLRRVGAQALKISALALLLWPSAGVDQAYADANDAAAAESDKTWQVERPAAATKEITIDVSAGTWMSLDVSPDGKSVAFDLLGDIYEVPITGGEARSVSSGMAWEMQPRYAPDGKTLAYISDRDGGDNIWLHSLENDQRRALTKEQFRLLNNPSFSPDGRFVVGRKHFTTGRSLGTGELWLYHVAGGSGQQLLARPNKKHQKELGEPVFAPDGQSIYFSKDTTPGPTFEYAQDSNGQIFEILELELATGEVSAVVSGAGGAARPTPSPDGKLLAFVRRDRARSGLWLKDLASGAERMLVPDLDQDMQEVWAVHGVYPNMAWTPDSSSIVYWAGGGIRRVAVATGVVSNIEFAVRDTRRVVPVVRPQQEVFTGLVKSRMARSPVVSPDGRRVVFEALGRLYAKTLPDGRPKRLTSDTERRFEFHPSFSADSRRVVFASWDDESLGSVRTVASRGGRSKVWSSEPGHYVEPAFVPGNKTSTPAVVVRNAGADSLRAKRYDQAGIYLLTEDGQRRLVSKRGRRPHVVVSPPIGARKQFDDQSQARVYFSVREAGKTLLRSVDLSGGNPRTHAGANFVTEFVMAPSGRWLAYRENYNVYAQPYSGFAVHSTSAEEMLIVGRESKGLPTHRVSETGGNYPAWAGDRLSFSLGSSLQWLDGAQLDQPVAAKPTAEAKASETGEPTKLEISTTSISVSAAADAPAGRVLLSNARIITMAGSGEREGVLESASILVDGNRIVAVGEPPASIPANTVRIDLSGKTVVPGFIDAHAHVTQGRTIIPEQNWRNYATLALGVTTIHDPSNDATSFFAAADLQRTGRILAPRMFSTGDVVYGAKSGSFAAIDSAEDALEHVQRLKAQGAGSIKNYNQPRRNQRQQVVAASQAENMLVVAEGGSLFHMDLSLVADGNATIEHNLPQSQLYEDVLQFWSQTEVAYTPTLVVTYGGLTAEHYWYQETDVWKHPLLSRYVPQDVLRPRSVRRQKAPLADYYHIRSAATAALLARRGVLVSIGAHGQREGLASHWEMWGFAQGGMTPMETLRTATITPARALGFDKELGSIEVGKLADLVILDSNPLEDIYRTDQVHKVMLNGRLYDAATLREEHTGGFIPRPLHWQQGE